MAFHLAKPMETEYISESAINPVSTARMAPEKMRWEWHLGGRIILAGAATQLSPFLYTLADEF